jgi:PAS domain-containing protein
MDLPQPYAWVLLAKNAKAIYDTNYRFGCTIARRRRLTQELAQQKQAAPRHELLVKAIFDYAIYMLDLDGFVTSWNTGAERIKGYSAMEITGQHFSRFFTPEDRASQLPERILAVARETGRHESGRLARAQRRQPLLVQCDCAAGAG